ncbi:caspase family protein [Methylorubrum extorquens]|uniref:caspase family protein n=1 Tax=Methylorubrum extorquens TaxID=408 RepID=UPI0011BE57BB|nr:caspase family protein [Methylorubrum extorquens]
MSRQAGRSRGIGVWAAALLLLMSVPLPRAVAQSLLGQGDTTEAIAVVIGNKSYRYTVPVDFAGNDAEAMRDFLVRSLGFREQNVVVLKDATRNELDDWFGPEEEPQAGKLWLRAKTGRSDVFVYYSGHGVPDLKTRQSFLLPSDGNPDRASSGYGLETLYRNLETIKQKVGPTRQVVVMLDACFTGETGRPDGRGLLAVSAPGLVPAKPRAGTGVVKLLATSGSAPANWDGENRLGLFTSRFLMGAAGLALEPGAAAEASGGRSAQVSWSQLQAYMLREVVEAAQRESRREQVPEIDAATFSLPVRPPVPAISRAVDSVRDDANWRSAQAENTRAAYERYIGLCGQVCAHREQAIELALGIVKNGMGVGRKVIDEEAWKRLSAQSKYQEYLDGCAARGGACAYQQIALAYLRFEDAPKLTSPPMQNVGSDIRSQQSHISEKTNNMSQDGELSSKIGGREQVGQRTAEEERSHWEAIKDTSSIAVIRTFLSRHPNSQYSDYARARQDELEQQHQAALHQQRMQSRRDAQAEAQLKQEREEKLRIQGKLAMRSEPKPKVAPDSPTGTGTGTWFVVMGSYPSHEREKALDRQSWLRQRSIGARLVNTNLYPNFTSNYTIVALGPFDRQTAIDQLSAAKRAVSDAYIKSGR